MRTILTHWPCYIYGFTQYSADLFHRYLWRIFNYLSNSQQTSLKQLVCWINFIIGLFTLQRKKTYRKRYLSNLPSVSKWTQNYSNIIYSSWIHPLDLSYHYIQYIHAILWSSTKCFPLVANIKCETHINFNK